MTFTYNCFDAMFWHGLWFITLFNICIFLPKAFWLLVHSRYFADMATRDEHFKTKRHKKQLASLNLLYFIISYLGVHLFENLPWSENIKYMWTSSNFLISKECRRFSLNSAIRLQNGIISTAKIKLSSLDCCILLDFNETRRSFLKKQ